MNDKIDTSTAAIGAMLARLTFECVNGEIGRSFAGEIGTILKGLLARAEQAEAAHNAALQCVAIEATARAIAEARVAELTEWDAANRIEALVNRVGELEGAIQDALGRNQATHHHRGGQLCAKGAEDKGMNEEIEQAVANLKCHVECCCDEAYTSSGMHDPHSACDYAVDVKIVADHIGELRTLLPDDLYDSKDWRHANSVHRVKWLITMLANKNQEIDLWVSMCVAASDGIEGINAKLAKAVEDAFCEGFAEGYDVTWVEGDYTHAWKKSHTLANLEKTK